MIQDPQTYISVLKNLSGEQSTAEREAFLKWRKESESNNEFYHKIKALWDQPEKEKLQRFAESLHPKK